VESVESTVGKERLIVCPVSYVRENNKLRNLHNKRLVRTACISSFPIFQIFEKAALLYVF